MNSYLHLDRKGTSPQQLAAVKPGIICVELRCYEFKGAWAERGGFEQHGQAVTGFSANEGSPDSPRNPPTYLLNEMSMLPPQVELSECKLGPRFSGEPNGASKLDGSVFSR